MMYRLYDYLSSGNSYKVRLLLAQLGIAHERVDLDIDQGETRTPEYLAKNPNGRIPALELENGEILPESDAILFYLAEGTSFLPERRLDRARVLQWMFFEQNYHEPSVAVSRYILQHTAENSPRRAELPRLKEKAHDVFQVMEPHLAGRDFFVARRYSIADIALYAYTHVAPEGNLDLGAYPAIRAWLERVRAQSGHIPITQG